MKHTLLLLALWLMATQGANCQTSKIDAKDTRLAINKESAGGMPMPGISRSKPHGLIAKAEGTPAKPVVTAGKPQTIESHTENLHTVTRVIHTNTEAIQANTKALQVNTQALEANLRAAQTNMHLRANQLQLAAEPVAAPATEEKPVVKAMAKTEVAEKPAPAAMPKPQPVMVAAKAPEHAPMHKEMAAPKTATKPQVIAQPVAVKPAVKPQPTVPVVAVKPIAKPQPTATAAVKPVAKPQQAITPEKVIKPAAAPIKIENAKAVAMAMPMAKPAAKAPEQPKIVPQAKAPAQALGKPIMLDKANRNVMLNFLQQLPLADKSFDGKATDSKHVPIVPGSGLKAGDLITTHGYLRLVATEDSAKENETYYLQLTVGAASEDSCFIVRIPAEQLGVMTTKESADNAKKFIREHLVKGKVPCMGGNIMRKPVYVSVTGELAYDAAHAGAMRGPKPVYQGKRGMRSYTAWEIKQISRIEFVMP
jgi:hypothetical protein